MYLPFNEFPLCVVFRKSTVLKILRRTQSPSEKKRGKLGLFSNILQTGWINQYLHVCVYASVSYWH